MFWLAQLANLPDRRCFEQAPGRKHVTRFLNRWLCNRGTSITLQGYHPLMCKLMQEFSDPRPADAKYIGQGILRQFSSRRQVMFDDRRIDLVVHVLIGQTNNAISRL